MSSNVASYSFYIDGIRCLGCVSNIEKALRGSEDVVTADVDFGRKVLRVSPRGPDRLTEIEAQVRKLGFSLAPADAASVQFFSERARRTALKQLAVAAACAGNIMMFVIPIYAGLEGPLRRAFEWISFFLFLPVLTYSARPFFVGAWAAVKSRYMNIDLPIAVALILTSGFSFGHLLMGKGDIYFDSTAGFVFLILFTRYMTEKFRSQTLNPLEMDEIIQQKKVLRIPASGVALEVDVKELQPGDLIELRRGDVLPVDAINCTANAAFDSSFINGESIPRNFALDASLSSGLRVLEEKTRVRVESAFHSSRLAGFIDTLNRTALSQTPAAQRADRLSHLLLSAVCGLALLLSLSGAWFGWSEMIARATALLVIACPCALAFAAPLTLGSFLKKAARKQIFIRDTGVFEDILACKSLILDKTGTLTYGKLQLVKTSPAVVTDETKKVILALEQSSEHPVAFAFRAAWPEITNLPSVTNVREQLGSGVSGEIQNAHYRLVRSSRDLSCVDMQVEFWRDQECLATFNFQDVLQEDSRSNLEKSSFITNKIYMLSGDLDIRTRDIGANLGLSNQNIFSEATPEKKAEVVRRLNPAIMIGDGVNDYLALAAAKVGIAVRGSFGNVLSSARVFIPRRGLSGVVELLQLSVRCRRTLNRNLTLALIYNSIGAALAIGGFITPLVAAVAMPISSALILISTVWGTK